MQNPLATKSAEPGSLNLRILELSGLPVTIGYSEALTPSAQAIVSRVNPVLATAK